MALEEIPLKRIRTPGGDVAEYSSFRDGLLTLAQAIIDLRSAFIRLDRKVVDDLNTMDAELSKVRSQVSGLREEVSSSLEELRKGIGKLVDELLASLEEKLAGLEKIVQEKLVPTLEDLRSQGSEVSRLVRLLLLRVEHLEARLSSLEEEVRRLAVLASARRERYVEGGGA